MKFQRILFPVDLSEQSRRVAPFVKALALRHGADVLMLHVMEIATTVYGSPPDLAFAVVIELDKWRLERRALVESFLGEEFAGVSVVRVMVEGDAAFEIVKYAKAERIDLIMMPTHGYGPFRALLLGSVTAKVLHDAECPVWTMAHTDEKIPDPGDRLHHILCGVDIHPEDVRTVVWAKDLANTEGASLVVLHALQGFDPATDKTSYAPAIEEAEKRMLKLFGVTVTEREIAVEFGTPAEVMRRIALDSLAELVVIGRGKIRKPLGRLRSHAYAIIRESPCPVISV
jgi:nucleotide-binding universal stress UspA family protein